MLSGKKAAVFVVGFGASLAVIGCVSFPSAKAPPPGLLTLPARQQAAADAAPDLRIPANPVVQAKNDIPAVPIPPFPRASSEPLNPPPDKMSPYHPIVPVAATTPAAPTPTPPAAPPLPAPTTPAAVAQTPTAPPFNPAPTSTPTGPPPAATTTAAPAPSATNIPAERGDPIKRLQQQAAQAYAGMDSYIARLTRREVVGGKAKPEEVMLFKFRKEPWSIYFKWLGEEGKGREVIYVKGRYGDKINTLLAAGDMPALLMPSDRRMALALDSSLVRSASRHSITEAGLGASVEHLSKVIAGMEHGDKKLGTLTDLGTQQRPEYPGKALAMIEHTIPPGLEPELPRGGKRAYGFDPDNHLPVLVVTRDDKGQEVEFYLYDRLQFPVKLDADDFDPDKLWKPPAKK
jgi:hypothetical protein